MMSVRVLSQVELEEQAARNGLEKLLSEAQEAENSGRASSTFYAKAVMAKYVERVAHFAESDLKTGDARRVHVKLVQQFDPRLIAFIAVGHTLDYCMNYQFDDDGNETASIPVAKLRRVIGTALYNEHFLTCFDIFNPELFHTLTEDLRRRRSKSASHYATVMKMSAKKANVPFLEWSSENVEQVGDWCIDLLVKSGMIEVFTVRESVKKIRKVLEISDEVMEMIIDRKAVVSYFHPQRCPFVEKPLPWNGLVGGGYHTKRMQNTFPRCVKATPTQLDRIRAANISQVTDCLNALQEVGWSVNQRVLDVQKALYRPYAEKAKPDPIPCHARDEATWTEAEKAQHKLWKRTVAIWYTENKLTKYKKARESSTMVMAEQFAIYPEFYFMYFADWRGRYYPVTSGISPQGPDNQKALLQFSEGMPVHTPEAIFWFKIHGTSKFGFDKVSTDERIQWVAENEELILACAADPVGMSEHWQNADKPWQFLAWCFEYSDWKADPQNFLNRIAISMDGSCNGLQNYSALGRDEIGGLATNLIPGPQPSDIYQMVADVALKLIQHDPNPLAVKWRTLGIHRKCVKRCVMTLPYGAKKFSFTRFIQYDYLEKYNITEFERSEYKAAADYLGEKVWEAIGMVVVQAIKTMSFFQKASRLITSQKGVKEIYWTAPSGLPIVQAYFKAAYVQCRSKVGGQTRLHVMRESDTVDKNAHADGVSPNVIHCFDASHLTATVNKSKRKGLRHFAMIHDDYGTHAANTEQLARYIRECFVEQYTPDVLVELAKELASQYKDPLEVFKSLPRYGQLDLTQVINSPYFFI